MWPTTGQWRRCAPTTTIPSQRDSPAIRACCAERFITIRLDSTNRNAAPPADLSLQHGTTQLPTSPSESTPSLLSTDQTPSPATSETRQHLMQLPDQHSRCSSRCSEPPACSPPVARTVQTSSLSPRCFGEVLRFTSLPMSTTPITCCSSARTPESVRGRF